MGKYFLRIWYTACLLTPHKAASSLSLVPFSWAVKMCSLVTLAMTNSFHFENKFTHCCFFSKCFSSCAAKTLFFIHKIKLILLKEAPQNPPLRRVLKNRTDTAVFDTKPMTPNMVSKFTDLLKPFCLYLSRFEVQIKKPAFNRTFLPPPLTKKEGAIKHGRIISFPR